MQSVLALHFGALALFSLFSVTDRVGLLQRNALNHQQGGILQSHMWPFGKDKNNPSMNSSFITL